MFNQRRSILKGKLFYIVLFILFAFGIWINAPIGNNPPEDVDTGMDYKEASDSGVSQKNDSDYDIMDNIIGSKQTEDTVGTAPEAADSGDKKSEEKGYFLVKEVDGVIMIFHFDMEGKESLVRKTSIAFSLLSTADQELFREGIVKYTPEELDELLQDFES